MNNNANCSIWEVPAKEKRTGRDGRLLDSPRTGGKYFISGTAEPML